MNLKDAKELVNDSKNADLDAMEMDSLKNLSEAKNIVAEAKSHEDDNAEEAVEETPVASDDNVVEAVEKSVTATEVKSMLNEMKKETREAIKSAHTPIISSTINKSDEKLKEDYKSLVNRGSVSLDIEAKALDMLGFTKGYTSDVVAGQVNPAGLVEKTTSGSNLKNTFSTGILDSAQTQVVSGNTVYSTRLGTLSIAEKAQNADSVESTVTNNVEKSEQLKTLVSTTLVSREMVEDSNFAILSEISNQAVDSMRLSMETMGVNAILTAPTSEVFEVEVAYDVTNPISYGDIVAGINYITDTQTPLFVLNQTVYNTMLRETLSDGRPVVAGVGSLGILGGSNQLAGYSVAFSSGMDRAVDLVADKFISIFGSVSEGVKYGIKEGSVRSEVFFDSKNQRYEITTSARVGVIVNSLPNILTRVQLAGL